MHHAYRGASAARALDVDDVIAIADAQIDALAGGAVQPLQPGVGDVAQRQPCFDERAEFEQPDAEAVGAAVEPLDETGSRHGREDTVRRGGVQTGFARERLERQRIGMAGEHVEQGGEPVDHLDRALRFGRRGIGRDGGRVHLRADRLFRGNSVARFFAS